MAPSLLAGCGNTREPLAWMMRPGSAGSSTAADHLKILDEAIAALPPAFRRRLMVTCDGAGASHDLVKKLDKLASRRGYELVYSVGWALGEREKAALTLVPETAWEAAIDAGGKVRERRSDGACANERCGHRACWIEEAHVTELTGLLREGPAGDRLKAWPKKMRVFARRGRPHPGAQLTLSETADGWRYSLRVTNLPAETRGWRGQCAYIDAGHRVHARIEDVIRTGKDTGLGHFPDVIFSSAIWKPSELRFCIVDSVVHEVFGSFPGCPRGSCSWVFPGRVAAGARIVAPAVRQVRAQALRVAGGSRIPGCGCGRWLLPGGAAARRVSRAAGREAVVTPGSAAGGREVVRSARAGRLGCRARSGRRWQQRRRC
jgi:hypothetical protein